MDRTRLSPGNCPCVSSGQTRLLQSRSPLEPRPAPGMELDPIGTRELKCSCSRVGCTSRKELHAARVPPQENEIGSTRSIITVLSVKAPASAAHFTRGTHASTRRDVG